MFVLTTRDVLVGAFLALIFGLWLVLTVLNKAEAWWKRVRR